MENTTLLRQNVLHSLLLFFLIGFAMDIKSKGPLQFTTTALSYGFFGVTLTVVQRTVYYCLNDNKTERLVMKMNNFFMRVTSTGLEEKSTEGTLKNSKKLTYGWVSYGVGASVVFALAPLIYVNENNRVLPMPMWLPYDWKSSPKYEMTYFAQVLSLVIMPLIHGGTDMFFAAIILLTSKQFELLGWEFKNSVYSCLLENEVSKEIVFKFREKFNGYKANMAKDTEGLDFSEVYAICDSREFSKSMLKRINKLIQFHQALLSFCADLEEFFSPLMLAFYLTIMAVAIFLNFVIITSKDLSLSFTCVPLSLAAYLEIFFPCFMANILSTQAQQLQMDLYELPWYICNKEYRVEVEFLLHKMQMPTTLTVGKFSNLDLSLFLWSIKTLNSYSIVMYQLIQQR